VLGDTPRRDAATYCLANFTDLDQRGLRRIAVSLDILHSIAAERALGHHERGVLGVVALPCRRQLLGASENQGAPNNADAEWERHEEAAAGRNGV
jgi:hypothetical protein